MRTRELCSTDLHQIISLLSENPHKFDQIRFQRLDREKLAKFHSTRILDRLDIPGSLTVCLENEGTFGLIGLNCSKSHSDFFEKLVFSISPVLSYKLNKAERTSLLSEVLKRARANRAEVVWMQFAEEESDWLPLLSREGGVYCGTDLRLSRPIEKETDEPSTEPRLRKATGGDLDALEAIAAQGHRHSHFFRDPHLPEEKRRSLFPEYVRKSVGMESRSVWIAEYGGKPMGFALLIEPKGQEESMGRKVGIVDFIVVDPDAQGRGVGRTLLRKSHRHLAELGYEYVELKTMLDNRQAINFYQREGYRLISSEVHFSLGL